MTPELFILRTSKSEAGIFGVVMDGDKVEFAVCLQTDFPYLPDGDYLCKKRLYHKGGYFTFEIIWPNSGHTDILFHKGNFKSDSKLCILLGESFEWIEGKRAIAQSLKGFDEFWSKYKDFEDFKLTIKTFVGF